MHNTSTHVVTGATAKAPIDAAINAVRQSIKLYGNEAQILHILIANIIKENKGWKAVVSVFRQPDLDDVPDPAITHCHLPLKYEDLFDALLPEVDHVFLIDDNSAWNDLKGFLLDVYFYQAVNFKEVTRLTDMPHGYFEESDGLDTVQSLEAELTLDPHKDIKTEAKVDRLFDQSFYKAADTLKAEVMQQKEDNKIRKMHDPKTKEILKRLKLFNAY